MKLGEIRDYIKQRGEASLADVANHFDISKEAAKLALDYWIRKGKIQFGGANCKSACSSQCSGGSCSTGPESEHYQWRSARRESPVYWV